MNLAFGILFVWIGAAMLFLASHGLQAASPWGAFQTVIGRMRAPDTAGG